MADLTIGSAASLQFAIDARQTLTSIGPSRGLGAPEGEIPSALSLERSGGGVRLNINDARVAVDVALVAGFGILAALKTLAAAFQLAADTGLSGSLTGLTESETRVSGINITAQAGRLVDAIDDLVKNARTANANLIASNGLRVTIPTTAFGGRITVSPQALDSAGLGIENLSAITRAEALSSLARIETAINLASTRLDNLEVLRNSLVPGRGLSSELLRVINSDSPRFLPRGSLINQTA